jgi:hypothetical protein
VYMIAILAGGFVLPTSHSSALRSTFDFYYYFYHTSSQYLRIHQVKHGFYATRAVKHSILAKRGSYGVSVSAPSS